MQFPETRGRGTALGNQQMWSLTLISLPTIPIKSLAFSSASKCFNSFRSSSPCFPGSLAGYRTTAFVCCVIACVIPMLPCQECSSDQHSCVFICWWEPEQHEVDRNTLAKGPGYPGLPQTCSGLESFLDVNGCNSRGDTQVQVWVSPLLLLPCPSSFTHCGMTDSGSDRIQSPAIQSPLTKPASTSTPVLSLVT